MLTLTPKLVTRYHIGIATNDWLRDLEVLVKSAITSHPEYQTSSGTGTVTSRYNEDRFMGPLSLIKNDFDVIVDVDRRFSFRKDRYEVTVRYAPDSDTFKTLREAVETVESKHRDARCHRIVTQFVKKIENGCQRDALNDFRCPWCDAKIEISFSSSGRTFAISCSNHHFMRHAQTESPPEWWRSEVTGGWLESKTAEGTDEPKPG